MIRPQLHGPFTPAEIELVNLYRNLTDENRQRLAQVITIVCNKAPVLRLVRKLPAPVGGAA